MKTNNNELNKIYKVGEIHTKPTCDACIRHIEKIATANAGVSETTWNAETKVLTIFYDESKTSLSRIEESIANAGHSTHNYSARIEFYSTAPRCCMHNSETWTNRG